MDEEPGRAFDQPAEECREATVDREGFLWLFFSGVFRVPAYGIENDVRIDEFDARLEFRGIQQVAVSNPAFAPPSRFRQAAAPEAGPEDRVRQEQERQEYSRVFSINV